MRIIWDSIWNNVSTKYKFPVYAYLLLPFFAIGLEIIGVIPKVLTQFLFYPSETIDSLMKIPEMIGEIINQIGG